MAIWGSHDYMFGLLQLLSTRQGLFFNRRLNLKTKNRILFQNPIGLHYSSPIRCVRFFQTVWPSVSNTLDTTKSAESYDQMAKRTACTMHHSLEKLGHLALDKLKTHSCTDYLVKVLKKYIQE